MLKYILFAIIGISQCYGMVQNNDNLIIEAINNKEELQKGLNLYFEIFYKLRKKEILTKEQEDALEEQRKNSLEQLLSISKRNDVFVKQKNEIIGFLASHLSVNDPNRVIFDNAFFDGKPEVELQVYEKLLTYVKKTYPQAEKVWFGFLKKDVNNFSRIYNFQESDYLDEFHQNKNIWQGWERKID